MLVLLGLNASVFAQPDQLSKADALFAEAKELAAAGTSESTSQALLKFEDASAMFTSAGSIQKVRDVALEHGAFLMKIGTDMMNAGKLKEARPFFESALAKFEFLKHNLQTAYAAHNLGYLAGQLGSPDEIDLYLKSLKNYQLADDKPSQAVILRNLGIASKEKKKYLDAAKYFNSALRIRTAASAVPEQSTLRLDLGDLYRDQKQFAFAFSQYNLGLNLSRRAKDVNGEALAHYRLGDLYARQYKLGPAIKEMAKSLDLYARAKDAVNEAYAAATLGRYLSSNGKYSAAEADLNKSLDIYKQLGDRSMEAYTSLDLASNYISMNRHAEARSAVERALKNLRDLKDHAGEAYAHLIDSDILAFFNRYDEALDRIRLAEKLFRQTSDADLPEYRIASSMGNYYYSLSNYGEAIKFHLRAVDLAKSVKDDFRQAVSLINLANAYSALQQLRRAIEYTDQANAIARKIGNRNIESITLSNTGYSYFKMRKPPQAELYLKRAIAIMSIDGYEREEGYATHNLGLVYMKKGQLQLAAANFLKANAIYLKTGDRRPEAFLYDSFGELYTALNDYDKASENLNKAIVLAREIRYSDVEGAALGNMMALWAKRGQPKLAILYGKQAINVYQSIRAGAGSVDKASQKSFVQSNEEKYRQLANLLIDEGRLAEAQQVLDLLKEEEYLDFVRRDASAEVDQAKVALTDSEKKALDEYTRLSSQLTSLGARFQTLQDAKSKAGGKLTAEKEAEYAALKTQIEEAGVGVRTFLTKLSAEFSKTVEDDATITPSSIDALRADLRSVGPDVVLVSTYLLPNRYRAIVTTGRAMVDRKVEYSERKLTQADINRKIAEFQRALQNTRIDPRPLGKELYDIFVKPIEGDLQGAGAKTILWSLDGTLRYIPMAALSPDGKTYLAEKYQNVIVTLARQSKLFDEPTGKEWRALGAGVSKPHEGFSALPSVVSEINSIVREGSSTGVLDGKKLIDEKFDLVAFRDTLPARTEDGKAFNVVHLATHFKLGANDQDSALLLGDGTRLSLFEISKDEDLDFRNVDLLTLSACQTAIAAGDGSGREVESLGMLAQKKGARAVLATLWKVADEPTAAFMGEFYRLKKADPKISKSEAIRLTQLAMIQGKLKPGSPSGGCRADDFGSSEKAKEFKCDPNAPFSHPASWSPFILIGNWR